MFWKNKVLNKDKLFSYHTSCRRDAFRYKFLPDDAAATPIKGREVHLIDISAGGLAVKGANLIPGESADVEIRLFNPDTDIKCRIKTISVDDSNIAHCKFENMPQEVVEIIHHYVLAKQKQVLRSEKNSSSEEKNS